MYTNVGYLNDSKADFEDFDHPLTVVSCGNFLLKKRKQFLTERPYGRRDYQLLYIASGKAHFYFGREETVVNAGNMILFRPDQQQKYIYYAKDKPEVFWVHFTGNDVKNILRHYGICETLQVINSCTSPEYARLFRQMIRELQLQLPMYEEVLCTSLKQILLLVNRESLKESAMGFADKSIIEEAVEYFIANYNQPISIKDYAQAHHQSVSWFIRGFKQYTHLTPMQYILSLRMANAQFLLEQTKYNVMEIASIVGYENPLYFSRLFKKQFGLSPAHYRKIRKLN